MVCTFRDRNHLLYIETIIWIEYIFIVFGINGHAYISLTLKHKLRFPRLEFIFTYNQQQTPINDIYPKNIPDYMNRAYHVLLINNFTYVKIYLLNCLLIDSTINFLVKFAS